MVAHLNACYYYILFTAKCSFGFISGTKFATECVTYGWFFFFFFGYVWFYLPCFHVGQSIHLNPLCIHKPRIPRQLKIVWSKYLALRSSYCEWRNTTRTNICSNIKSHKSVVQTVNVQRAHCAADFVPSLKVHGLFINGNR